jgi:hypothetical protein
MEGAVAVSIPAEAAPTAVAAPSPSRTRLAWLDWYRGLAVLVMIETHVANTFLFTADWPPEWRANLNYLNGLVAPSFLFIAGFAHGLGLRRKRAVRAHMGPRLWKLAGIAALGYGLHLPWDSLLAGRWSEALVLGSRMNILPCLAAGIALLIIIERLCGKWVKAGVAVAALAVLLIAPLAATWTTGPAPLLALINPSTGSLFPLPPWIAFTFLGFLVSGLTPSFRTFALPIAAAGAVVALIGRAQLTPTSAAFFCERLAWILLLVPLCAWIGRHWAPAPVLYAGRESLPMYVAHLCLITALLPLGQNRQGITITLGLLALVLAGTFAAAWAWRKWASRRAGQFLSR